MIHCKHSRTAKSAERPISERQRGRSLASHRTSFFFFFLSPVSVAHPFEGLRRVEGEVGQLKNHATRDRVCPGLYSSPLRLVYFFPPFLCLVVVCVTACPSWTCPLWQGLPAPCLDRWACAARPGSAGQSSARLGETACLRQSWHRQRPPMSWSALWRGSAETPLWLKYVTSERDVRHWRSGEITGSSSSSSTHWAVSIFTERMKSSYHRGKVEYNAEELAWKLEFRSTNSIKILSDARSLCKRPDRALKQRHRHANMHSSACMKIILILKQVV